MSMQTRTWHPAQKTPPGSASTKLQRQPGKAPATGETKEFDEELQGRAVQVWLLSDGSIPQPLSGRLVGVGRYLLQLRTERGETWSIYKHGILALCPVDPE